MNARDVAVRAVSSLEDSYRYADMGHRAELGSDKASAAEAYREEQAFRSAAHAEALVAIALALTEPPKPPEPRTVVMGR